MAALIDADIISYIAASMGETVVDWGDGDPSVTADLNHACEAADATITQWVKDVDQEELLLCWSDRTCKTFRYHIHPHYKAQRTGRKPVMLEQVAAYMAGKYPSVCYPHLEGDDVIGILATTPGRNDTMVSTDKDMNTIPGFIQNPRAIEGKHQTGLHNNTILRADQFWMMQTIMGDKTDNFKGAPGAGEKAAEKALDGCFNMDDMWDAVMATYDKQFAKPRWREKFVHDNTYDEAVMNARCARILRHGEYNHQTGEVTLWTP